MAKRLENFVDVEDAVEEKPNDPSIGLDIMAQQLKFVACLKILTEVNSNVDFLRQKSPGFNHFSTKVDHFPTKPACQNFDIWKFDESRLFSTALQPIRPFTTKVNRFQPLFN